ncbi:MAG: threonine synthase [archaeon]
MAPKNMKLRHIGIWKYHHFLPVPENGEIVSLDEGKTTLLESTRHAGLHYKLEFENPTGSFKDRGSTVEISHAVSDGYQKVVCASTGNMGASIAAYSARAGIEATIVVPGNVPPIKLKQIQSYGAKLIKMKGTYTDALKKTWEMAAKDKEYMLTGDYPLRMEGQKTIGLEIVEQLGMKSPDHVIVPIGNGTLIVALHAAFTQMIQSKTIKKMPRLIGVQAKNCNPLGIAWKNKTTHFTPVKKPHTIAGAIECGNPVYGMEVLTAVRMSKGEILSVSEEQMKKAKLSLAQKEGLYTEYSGAAVQAVVEDRRWKGTTIALLCGHGLKE